jgi:GTP:adenosylcobinamide-phosphate guanylyltransferase/FtsZ-binding cell division protein ZapB
MLLNEEQNNWHLVVMAGGHQTLFSGLNKTKHLVEVIGKPILERSIQLLLDCCAYPITVVTPPTRLEEYSLIHNPRVQYIEGPKSNSSSICNALEAAPAGNLIMIWGDVFFNRVSLNRIVNENSSEPLEVYCRYGPSKLTLKPWGEPFALRVQTESREKLLESAVWVQKAFESGEIWRASEWEVFKKYAEVENKDGYRVHPKLSFYREINDFTEDVDFPQDYENMLLTVPSNLEDALDLISKLHSKSVMEIETLEQEKQTLEQEKQTLEQEKQTLEQEKQTLEQEKQTLETVLFRTMNSRSWRITKPLRSVVMFIRTMI